MLCTGASGVQGCNSYSCDRQRLTSAYVFSYAVCEGVRVVHACIPHTVHVDVLVSELLLPACSTCGMLALRRPALGQVAPAQPLRVTFTL